MDNFKVDLYEIKPKPTYVMRAEVNLHSGKATIQERESGEGLVFERIHQTAKSKLTFLNAERKEGIIYFYFIVLDNKNSYLYIIGETNERALIRGGIFIETDDNGEAATAIITKYIESTAKKMSALYTQEDSSGLIDILNKASNKLLDLMP